MEKSIRISEIKDIESITLVGNCEDEKFEVIIETPIRTFRTCTLIG